MQGIFVKKLLFVGLACWPLTGCFGEYSEAINYGESQVKQSLKDPDSAKFSDLWFSPDANNGKPKISGYVCGRVNAKNAFGAYVGEAPFFIYVGELDSGFYSGVPGIIQSDDEKSMKRFEQFCKK
ncbi:hypothetical protein E4A63_17390 [Salmonella enterica subsp. enterica serovar Ank]|nr:hypothetical protein [Salmonella enterica subsp. enterica serovar Ank]